MDAAAVEATGWTDRRAQHCSDRARWALAIAEMKTRNSRSQELQRPEVLET